MGLTVRNIRVDGYLQGVFPQVPPSPTPSPTPPPPPPPFTADTSILVYGTGANNTANNTFIDSSSNNFTITRVGNTTQGSFSPFSNGSGTYNASTMGGSIYFDGAGDGLTLGNNAAFAFGTGDFTVDCWVYLPTAVAAQSTIVTNTISAGSPENTVGLYLTSNNRILVSTYNTVLGTSANNAVTTGSWNHIAFVRGSGTISVWSNGTRVLNFANTNNYDSSLGVQIGIEGAARPLKGYISNLRMVKGTAVYSPSSATITIPTSLNSAISGTSLLLNGTNGAIIDETGRNDIETVGTAKISTAISANGSMRFDGSGNLRVPNSDRFNFGSGDFTIEFYVNITNRTVTGSILSLGWPSGNPWLVYVNGGAAQITFYASSANAAWNIASGSVITSITENTWYHIAITRSGNTIRTFANGTLVNTITSSAAIVSSSSALTVGGGDDNGQRTQCYVQDLRLTKGLARYTANFTPPTLS